MASPWDETFPGQSGGGGGGGGFPPYNIPGGLPPLSIPSTTPNPTGANSGINWQQILPWLIGGGLGATGAVLNARSQGQQLDFMKKQLAWLQGLAAQEQARRNTFASMMLPSIMQSMGNRNPQSIAQAQQAINTAQWPGQSSTAGQVAGSPAGQLPASSMGVPATPSAGGSTALNIGKVALPAVTAAAGTGALGASVPAALGMGGSAGLLGLGAATVPVLGAALFGASLLANKIGQGRRTADQFVQGVENPFGQKQLPDVLNQFSSDPTGARQAFASDYANYLNQNQAWQNAGGWQQKVAQQSLSNPLLSQTASGVAQGIGIPNFTWGQPYSYSG